MADANAKKGRVYLIGAGPGDPDLITVKGYTLLNSCNVIIYDNLIPHELIVTAPPNVKKIYVGKIADAHTLPQEKINELLVEEANKGNNVARLKGGDPFVFGRGGEEAEYLRQHGIEYEIIPGITAGIAAADSAGIPASHRNMSSAILLATAHGSTEHDLSMNWKWAGKIGSGTVIGYMGVRQLPNVVRSLIEGGMPPETESAMVERCCFSTQKIVRAKLKDLPQEAERQDVHPPAIFIIGEVASLADKLAWYDRKLLSNVRIMVTRPADQSKWIYQILRGYGAEVQPYPTIKTSFTEDKEGWEGLAQSAKENDSWLLFTSENGVRYFFGYLKSKNVDLRLIGKFRIAATGFGTLRSLNTLGYHADFTPDLTGTVPFAEKLCEDVDIEGSHIVRVRGKLPNDPVEEILKQAGAQVHPLTLYRTEPVKWQEHEIRRMFWHPPHMIMFTSGRSVDGLVSNLGQEKALELAKLSKIATIGPTTTAVASKYNIKVEIEAERHSIPDLINDIVKYYLNKKA